MAMIGDVVAVLRAQVGSWVGGMRQAQTSALSVDSAVRRLAVQLGTGFGIVKAGQFVLNTAKTFEELENRLQGATQSAQEAQKAFAFLQGFTQATPFGLEDTTKAFIQLRLLGIGPTREMLTDLGNIAAATGRTMEDLSDAVQSAALGNSRALRSFGIAAKADGAAITLTFQGISRTVRNDAPTIIAALQDISKENFAGGMAEDMNNLVPLWNKFRDALQQVAQAIGRAVIPELKRIIIHFTWMAKWIGENSNAVAAWAAVWVDATNLIIQAFALLIRAAFNAGQMIGNILTTAILSFKSTLIGATAQAALWKDLWDKIKGDGKDIGEALAKVGKAIAKLMEDTQKAGEAAGGGISTVMPELEGFSTKIDGLKIKMEDVADAIAKLFAGLLDGWRGLLDAIKSIVKELVVAIAKALILKALLPSKSGKGGGGKGLAGFFNAVLDIGKDVALAYATGGSSTIATGAGKQILGDVTGGIPMGASVVIAGPPMAATNPLAASRDAEWMKYLSQSLKHLQASGVRLG